MSQTSFDDGTPRGAAPDPPDLTAFDDCGAARPWDNGKVPDGVHGVRVDRVSLGRSRAGDPMLTYDLIVLSGRYANRHIFKNSVITRASLPFVLDELKALGLELRRFSELPSHLGKLAGLTLEVTKQTKGQYANVDFKKRALPYGPALPFAPD